MIFELVKPRNLTRSQKDVIPALFRGIRSIEFSQRHTPARCGVSQASVQRINRTNLLFYAVWKDRYGRKCIAPSGEKQETLFKKYSLHSPVLTAFPT